MLEAGLKVPLATATPNPARVLRPRAHLLFPLRALPDSLLCFTFVYVLLFSSLQKDRQRWAPQIRKLATSLRAAMGPPRLESDLAHGGWKRDLLSSPGQGALALASQPLL